MFTLTFRYSPSVLRRYYLRELWRTQGAWLLFIPISLAAAAWSSLDPTFWWFAGFLCGFGLASVLFFYNSYRVGLRQLLAREITITLTDGGLCFATPFASSDVRWIAIRSVRQSPEGLILYARPVQRPILLPSDVLTEELEAFVFLKVKEAGGRAGDGA